MDGLYTITDWALVPLRHLVRVDFIWCRSDLANAALALAHTMSIVCHARGRHLGKAWTVGDKALAGLVCQCGATLPAGATKNKLLKRFAAGKGTFT